MDSSEIRSDRAGSVSAIPGGLCAFVPDRFPPTLRIEGELLLALSRAEAALGALDGAVGLLPAMERLVVPMQIAEAAASCRIEGASLDWEEALEADLLPSVPTDTELHDIKHYLQAQRVAWSNRGTMPLDLEAVRMLHGEIMTGPRGNLASPGEFRQIQIFVGVRQKRLATASYVPPPQALVPGLMQAWERYAQEDGSLPPLLQTALLHGQFELIHPFRDGNGKTGRLLMGLFLQSRGRLQHPVLFLSQWFEKHRRDYYELLRGISHDGEWEEWALYFLDGVTEQSAKAVTTLRELARLREDLRCRLKTAKATSTALNLIDTLFENPYTSTARVTEKLGVSVPTARGALALLANCGVIEELTGRKRGQRFCATPILEALRGPVEEVPELVGHQIC